MDRKLCNNEFTWCQFHKTKFIMLVVLYKSSCEKIRIDSLCIYVPVMFVIIYTIRLILFFQSMFVLANYRLRLSVVRTNGTSVGIVQ